MAVTSFATASSVGAPISPSHLLMISKASLFLAVTPVTKPSLSYSTAILGFTLIRSVPPEAGAEVSVSMTISVLVSSAEATASVVSEAAVSFAPAAHPVRLERPITIAITNRIRFLFFIISSFIHYMF